MTKTGERTISMKKLRDSGINTWSRKSDTPRGVEDVSTDRLRIGDKIVIDNYFHKITG